MTGRPGLRTAVLLCLAGASVVLVAAGRSWVSVEIGAGPLAEASTVWRTGTDIVPGLSALGLLGLAGVVALAATRRAGRTLVGLVLLGTGAGVLAAVLTADLTAVSEPLAGSTGEVSSTTSVWPSVTGVGGVLLALAGVLTGLRGRSWPALGQRYDAPASSAGTAGAPQVPTERGLWEALDRGEDPTANLGTLAGAPADREADRT